MKICIIGLGNMGSAMASILSSQPAYEVSFCERNDDVNAKIAAVDVLVLAIKPQQFQELAANISTDLSKKLVISIMAGITIEKMSSALKTDQVVRTLPNLALKVEKSMTLWKAAEAVNEDDKHFVREFFSHMGEQLELDEEKMIDPISAICGCGPGFLAFIVEQMSKSAVGYGLSVEQADKIALQTLAGTAAFLESEKITAEELRRRVSSKGGLTEAGVNHMIEAGLDKTFIEAIEVARKRSEELNG